ncbi:hypothetical protein ASG84_26410 [Rhodococcus sp. Leaf278]|uniref:hypothetical protein n=1 Tax=Rhodococcus sp. Leaf278 TaxID=1736319 RepID=UPI00070B29F3|nr:hypothetical protein [Rhodococcus sp. Leaf278]KQU49258.1 hypothetical protein ASG84_26410 [Rhodococcus sp. Leaf278]
MRRYPQNWSVLRDNPPVYDESTGNKIPVPPTAVPVTGLLSLRFLETKQEQHPGDLTTSQMVLQINAPVPGGLNGRDRLRFEGDSRTDGADATNIVEVGQLVYVRRGTGAVHRCDRRARIGYGIQPAVDPVTESE